MTAQNDISDIKTKNTQQDAAISGLQSSKVNVAQGAENAGKALVVGSDGNVTVGNVGSGEYSIYTGTLKSLFDYSNYRFTRGAAGRTDEQARERQFRAVPDLERHRRLRRRPHLERLAAIGGRAPEPVVRPAEDERAVREQDLQDNQDDQDKG